MDDKVGLLLGGAVDYMTKPFETKELLARVAVRLKEHSCIVTADIYTYGKLTLSEVFRAVAVGEKTVVLTRTEFAILKLLIQNRGHVIAKSVLLERIQAERLFERFYTVESAKASTGLGLSIARLLTEKMTGNIKAEYTDGELVIQVDF